jgi:hypothetical protein
VPKSKQRRRPKGAQPRPSTAARGPASAADVSSLSAPERIERDRQRKLREWRKRKRLAWGLFILGALVGLAHLGEHLGAFTVYRSGVDDIVAGYPLAGLLIVIGAMKLPPR